MNNISLSKVSYFICAVLMLFSSFFYYPKWKAQHGENTLGWDVSGYYWYLPSVFVYNDIKQQKFGDSIIDKYGFTPSFEQSFLHESGNRVITYSGGMALMYLPFFTVAHLVAEPLGFPADGFSMPYAFMLTVGSTLIALIGLWQFRRLLLLYYSDRVTALTILLLVMGTSYLGYSTLLGSLTHNWLFTVYVFLLLSTYKFYQRPNYKHAIYIGLLVGLATLIRPSEIISCLIPLLWGLENVTIKSIKQTLAFFKRNWTKLFLSASCALLVASIQVIYWLYATGKPLVYSYQEKGFSW